MSDIFNLQDKDGRWFKFYAQQMGNSCTVASARIAKEYYTNSVIGEDALRGIATLFEYNSTNRGIPALRDDVTKAKDWDTSGGYEEITLKVLKSEPLPIPEARSVSATPDLLRTASRNHPVLIGWRWATGGGHVTVCVGSMSKFPDQVVILDPYFGLQYLSLGLAGASSFTYKPVDKSGVILSTGIHEISKTFFIVTT